MSLLFCPSFFFRNRIGSSAKQHDRSNSLEKWKAHSSRLATQCCHLYLQWRTICHSPQPHTLLLVSAFHIRHTLPYSHKVDDKRQNQPVSCGMSRPHPWHHQLEARGRGRKQNKTVPTGFFTDSSAEMRSSLLDVDLKSASVIQSIDHRKNPFNMYF